MRTAGIKIRTRGSSSSFVHLPATSVKLDSDGDADIVLSIDQARDLGNWLISEIAEWDTYGTWLKDQP